MDQPKSTHTRPNTEIPIPCAGTFQWDAKHISKKVIAVRECPVCGKRQWVSKGQWIDYREANPKPGTDMLKWSPR